jgi:hypothetical protein
MRIRGRGWALSISLIQLPYYQHTNPALAANSRHVIAEVLADTRCGVRSTGQDSRSTQHEAGTSVNAVTSIESIKEA